MVCSLSHHDSSPLQTYALSLSTSFHPFSLLLMVPYLEGWPDTAIDNQRYLAAPNTVYFVPVVQVRV